MKFKELYLIIIVVILLTTSCGLFKQNRPVKYDIKLPPKYAIDSLRNRPTKITLSLNSKKVVAITEYDNFIIYVDYYDFVKFINIKNDTANFIDTSCYKRYNEKATTCLDYFKLEELKSDTIETTGCRALFNLMYRSFFSAFVARQFDKGAAAVFNINKSRYEDCIYITYRKNAHPSLLGYIYYRLESYEGPIILGDSKEMEGVIVKHNVRSQ